MSIIFDTIKELQNFRYFLDALLSVGLLHTLKGAGPWTLFLPWDQAFAQIPEKALKRLLSDTKKLETVIGYHLVSGAYSACDLLYKNKLKTLAGYPLKVSGSDEIEIFVDDALITRPDIKCANGVIHIIDSVLIPRQSEQLFAWKQTG